MPKKKIKEPVIVQAFVHLCNSCGEQIPQGRIDAFKKMSKPLPKTCTDCSTTERVAGVMVTSGKTERELQVLSQESAAKHIAAGRRMGGQGISRGSKMNQSFDHRVFK